jgi:hypothetical protein
MRQDQVTEFQAVSLTADTSDTGSDKKVQAPIELSLDVLGKVGGGLLPNGTWSSESLPNGTW